MYYVNFLYLTKETKNDKDWLLPFQQNWHRHFASNRCIWMVPQGVLGHTPCKRFNINGRSYGSVSAFPGDLMHAVNGIALVLGANLHDCHKNGNVSGSPTKYYIEILI